MDYLEFNFKVEPKQPWTDLLVTELAEVGFESFVDEPEGTLAYIQVNDFKKDNLKEVSVLNMTDVTVTFTQKTIPSQNWNETWESAFDPIEINDKCWIRAPFHTVDNRPFDVLISPQMAFGTGHHETTFLISQTLFNIPIQNKTVLDMGCGTGVLALLAEKLGALNVLAIDIDEYAYENTVLNLSLNKSEKITVEKGDATTIGNRQFEIIIANINKNILMNDLKTYAQAMLTGAQLFLSGFFKTDVEELTACAEKVGLQFVNSVQKNDWAMIQLKKS
jgi:ribosomal protein L11 methyltransferase